MLLTIIEPSESRENSIISFHVRLGKNEIGPLHGCESGMVLLPVKCQHHHFDLYEDANRMERVGKEFGKNACLVQKTICIANERFVKVLHPHGYLGK